MGWGGEAVNGRVGVGRRCTGGVGWEAVAGRGGVGMGRAHTEF